MDQWPLAPCSSSQWLSARGRSLGFSLGGPGRTLLCGRAARLGKGREGARVTSRASVPKAVPPADTSVAKAGGGNSREGREGAGWRFCKYVPRGERRRARAETTGSAWRTRGLWPLAPVEVALSKRVRLDPGSGCLRRRFLGDLLSLV